MKRKVLIVANSPFGLYRFRKEIIYALLKDIENEIYISVPFNENLKVFSDKGCKIVDTFIDRRGYNPVKDLSLLLKYKKIIKEISPDIVITFTIKPNIYVGFLCRLFNIKYFSNITGLGSTFQKKNILNKLVVFMYKIGLKKAKIVFFQNSDNVSSFLKYKIVTNEQVKLLNGSGVNLNDFKYQEYPSSKSPIYFLFVGRIMKEKGINEFFECAKKIKNEFPHVSFNIVGSMEENYRDLISEYKVNDIVNYYGIQKNVATFYKKAHCIILPSYHEGMSNVLLEAGACGRPLIASNIHGCKETLLNNKTGFLVNPRNSEDLYKKILLFIELDYKTKKDMGIESRQYIENKFDKKLVVNESINCLYKFF